MEKVIAKAIIENFDKVSPKVESNKKEFIGAVIALGVIYLGYKFYDKWSTTHFRKKEETHKFELRKKTDEGKSQRRMKEKLQNYELKIQYHNYKKEYNSNEKLKCHEAEEEKIRRMVETEPIESFDEILSTPCEEEKNLVGPIFPSGGITLLAGEKGLGKTSLITQALLQLSGSKECELFPKTKINNTQQVVYFDYELTKEQFKKRYKNIPFKKIKFIWDSVHEKSSLYLINRINKILSKTREHTTIVIDNLTKIKDLNSPKNYRDFYAEIENIRTEYKAKHNIVVSFIIVAHVNLKKPKYKSVDLEDIQTSSRFINFADSVILIGRTRFKEAILLKVCKNRNGKDSSGSAYVFKREEGGFLHYEYQGEFTESDILPKKKGTLESISIFKKKIQENNKGTEFKQEVKRGRKTILTEDIVKQMLLLRSQGISKNEVSKTYGVKRQGFNKAVKRYGLVDNYN